MAPKGSSKPIGRIKPLTALFPRKDGQIARSEELVDIVPVKKAVGRPRKTARVEEDAVNDAATSPAAAALPPAPAGLAQHGAAAVEYQLDSYSEYVRLAKLAATIVPGSVEAERVFSTMSYIKNKQRNRLEQRHLSLAVRMKVQRWFTVTDFPYAKALATWRDNAAFRWE